MPKELTDEQIIKILKKLPEDLKDALFSAETAEKISEVSEKYEIPGKKIPLIVNYVGQVLLGILPPEELERLLEKEAGLKKDAARAASQQLYRYIFFPVKESLSALSGTSGAPPPEPKIKTEKPTAPPKTEVQPPPIPEEREHPQAKDTYREPVE